MSLWTDLLDEVYTLTNRPELVAETAIALRKAVRTAHASSRFWRDLVEVPITGLAVQQVQEIQLDLYAPRFRQTAYIKSNTYTELHFEPVTIDDLLDADGYGRVNAYWGFGNTIRVRAANIEDNYLMAYYQYPIVTPEAAFNSWIVNEHRDFIITSAALIVLGIAGEQEIKNTMQQLNLMLRMELVQANLEVNAR